MKPLLWKINPHQGTLVCRLGNIICIISTLGETAFLDVQSCNGDKVLREFHLGAYPRVKEAQQAAHDFMLTLTQQ